MYEATSESVVTGLSGVMAAEAAVGGVLFTVTEAEVATRPKLEESLGFTVKYHTSPLEVADEGTVNLSL